MTRPKGVPTTSPLGLWWGMAVGLVTGVVFAALAHPLWATVTFAGTLVGAAGVRAFSTQAAAGGLVVRRRWIDVTILLLLGVAVGIVGRSMNLHPNT